jgi:hypothetical protein
MVKKLMRPLARSLSGVHPTVRDTELGLDTLCLGWTKERAGHCPSPDDSARDGDVHHPLSARARERAPQTGSTATGTLP